MNALELAQGFIDRCVAAGVRHIVVCPGSRSAPLAYAAASLEGVIDVHVETDERVAGFLALGLGVSGVPAVVVTTSGTAVANLHPAVAEAYHGGIPLIVASADRPAHIRGRGSNQTTQQAGMFSTTIRGEVDLTDGDLSRIEPLLVEARRGPVHINICFDNPLHPSSWGKREAVVGEWEPPAQFAGVVPLDDRPTVVVAGASGPNHEWLGRAARGEVPILAEPTAWEINGPVVPAPLSVLPKFADQIERVVVTGHPTLSRPITSLISRSDVELVVVDDDAVPTNLTGQAHVVSSFPAIADQPEWTRMWMEAGEVAWERGASYADLDSIGVGKVLATDPGRWMLGASSIIRDVFTFARSTPGFRYANRGLAGIDGTMSTARGLAHEGPIRVAVGDLTFLHDLGSLVPTVGEKQVEMDVLVVDDHGGGIFAGLEHGEENLAPVFDRVFRTEKNLSVGRIASALGWNYELIGSLRHLEEVLATPPSHTIFHVDYRMTTETKRRKARVLKEKMAIQ